MSASCCFPRGRRAAMAGCGLVLVVVGCSANGEVLSVSESSVTAVPSGAQPVLLTDAGAVLPNPARDVFVSAGDAHSCAVVAGDAYCWGNGAAGQLGRSVMGVQSQPAMVPATATFVTIAAAHEHTCALDDLGRVYCWGSNARGQLGLGDRTGRFGAEQVTLPQRAAAVTTRFDHTCAILIDASLYCWGQNGEGELGQGDPFPGGDVEAADRLTPTLIPVSEVRAVGTGQGHTCAIRLDGSLWCWGRNAGGELGVVGDIQIRSAVQVGTDTDWLQIAPGQNHTCALKDDQTLWCWGRNVGVVDGEGAPLGIDAESAPTPVRVGTEADWVALSSNTFHSCALKPGGALYCWGRNAEGQLGFGDTELRGAPELVGGGFAQVSTGRFHSCAVRDDGVVECSGQNSSGQLGLGDTERRAEFTRGQ